MENKRITADFRYSMTLAFVGLITSSYLHFLCTNNLFHGGHRALQHANSTAWLPPLLLTSLQTAMCITLLRFSFSKFRKDPQSIDSTDAEARILQNGSDSQTRLKGNAPEDPSHKFTGSTTELESTDGSFGYLNGIDVTHNVGEKYDSTITKNGRVASTICAVNKEVVAILFFSHASVTYLFYLSALSDISKSGESLLPLIVTFVCFTVTGRRQSMWAIFSTLAMTIAGVWIKTSGVMRLDLLFLVTVVLLSTRNITMKIFHEHCITIELRSYKTVMYWLLFAAVVTLTLYLTAHIRWMVPCILGFLSSAFFLISSYLSTVVILRQISLFTHAVMEVSKHLLIAILLSVCYSDRIQLVSLAHVLLFTAGFLLYILSEKEQATNQVSLSEESTRLMFVIYLAVIFGFLFHNIPLQLSERDLSSLKTLHLQKVLYYVRQTFKQLTRV